MNTFVQKMHFEVALKLSLLIFMVLAMLVGRGATSNNESDAQSNGSQAVVSPPYQLTQIETEFDPEPVTLDEFKLKYDTVVSLSTTSSDSADYTVDGVEDDAEINRALMEVFEAGGGVVYLFPGTYHVTTSIGVFDNVTLKGAGRVGKRTTVVRLVDNADSMAHAAGIVRLKKDFERTSEAKRVTNVVLEDFIIDGNRDGQRQDVGDAEKKYGIYSEGESIVFRRITVRNCMGYGFDPHSTVDTIPSRRMVIEQNYAYGNYKDGFTLDHVEDSVLRGNISERNDRHGINMVTNSSRVEIANNVSRFNGSVGVMGQNGANSLDILDNEIYGNGFEGVNLLVSNTNTIARNIIVENSRYGVRLQGSSDNEVTNNMIANNSQSDVTHYDIQLQDKNDTASINNRLDSNYVLSIDSGAIRELDNSNFNQISNSTITVRERGVRINLVGQNSLAIDNTLKVSN